MTRQGISSETSTYITIAGHYDMYQSIFDEPVQDSISVFDSFALNKKLFSYYPYPDFGGNVLRAEMGSDPAFGKWG